MDKGVAERVERCAQDLTRDYSYPPIVSGLGDLQAISGYKLSRAQSCRNFSTRDEAN
jgi:hypothetical protein